MEENVEKAVKRLEQLLQEWHVSSSDHGKEHLKATCSDLERRRKLKKEAEFLEASFRASAASSFQQALIGILVLHASFRTPNLKAHLGNSERRCTWR